MGRVMDMFRVVKTDHPDLVGGIVWSDCELKWINERITLAILAEREACAMVCESMIDPVADSWREKRPDEAAHFDTCDIVCQNFADTIRLRSNK